MSHQSIEPRWLNLETAVIYSGLSETTLRQMINGGHVVSSNVVLPGNSRGRRVIDRLSLDSFIETGIGGKSELAMNSTGKGGAR